MHILYDREKRNGKTGTLFLTMCRSHETLRHLIPESCELLLPRFRAEPINSAADSGEKKRYQWVVECWWRSAERGTLNYYVKIELSTAGILEFRELPGDWAVPGMNLSGGAMSYLDQAAAAWKPVSEGREEMDALDGLWQSLVPEQLKEYVSRKTEAQTLDSYLLPVEALSCWSWEQLRDMLLKRENTTAEEILDYIEYKNSGSDKRYITPKHRVQAKTNGLKFWRDEDDI